MDAAADIDETTFLGYNKINSSRLNLPIAKHSNNLFCIIFLKEKEIYYSIENYSCTIIIAETGSGKTTC